MFCFQARLYQFQQTKTGGAMARGKGAVAGLRFVSTQALIDEVRRRSLGCLIAVVRAEERGDEWRCAVKGSPILLGALSATLSMEAERTFKGSRVQGLNSRAAELNP